MRWIDVTGEISVLSRVIFSELIIYNRGMQGYFYTHSYNGGNMTEGDDDIIQLQE